MLKREKVEKLIKAYQESGLTVRDFCYNQGISTSSFYYNKHWLESCQNRPILAPILIKDNSHPAPTIQEEDVMPRQIRSKEPTAQVLEMKYPNGIELRLTGDIDLQLVQALLNPKG